jgi:hypothetical protein
MRVLSLITSAALLLEAACCHKPVVDRVANPGSGEKPLDLYAQGTTDDSGLPLEPRWKYQWDGHGKPDPNVLCSRDDEHLDLARCTSQSPALDVAAGFADAICTFGTRQDIHGHANWWPATYRGVLNWDSECIDGDYTFSLIPEGEAGLVTVNGNAFHAEFDSRETVDYFDTPWWDDFRKAVTGEEPGGPDPGSLVNGRPAVLTGLFGLDCEHKCKSELHPVYVFAVQTSRTPDEETWAFFARNWGNEGFCSRSLHLLPIDTVTFRIPWRCGATSVTVAPDTVVKKTANVRSDPRIVWAPGEGVVVELDLPRADPNGARPRAHGQIHLAWTMGGPCAEAKAEVAGQRVPTGEKEEEDSAEKRLQALGAPEGQVRALARPPVPIESRDTLRATPQVNRVEHLDRKAPITAAVRPPEAKEKLVLDQATVRRRCEAERSRGRTPPECGRVLEK